MEVENQHDDRKGSFYIEDAGKRIAMMYYVFSGPGKFIIVHTEVNDEYEGKGLGRQLVEAGVKYARENHLKILPRCPYARKVFDTVTDYQDVLF